MERINIDNALPIGTKLRSKERTYEIVKGIGSGSFGNTYLATASVKVGNISSIMKFAIKEHFVSASCYRHEDGVTVLTVPNAKSDVADSRADFIAEANRLKKLCLKSRNIVSVNETFEANGTAYYVMEYLDGGNPSKCPEDEAVSIVMQIADALEKIHDDGIIHMDLRPDNIVMKTNEKTGTYPVLIDFGISLYFDSKGKSGTTLTIKGNSPGFSPPEQEARKCEFSPQYDIYALGAVLYYLCLGKTPPEGKDISSDQRELKEMLEGKVSANVETAILNAMKPDAEERTSSIQKFRDDIMGIVCLPTLEVSEDRLDFSKERSQRTIEVDSNIDWAVYADEDWCILFKTNETITISVSKNNESNARTCNIFVNGLSENLSHLIHVRQSGRGTIVFHKDTWWVRNIKKACAGISVIGIVGCIIGLYIWLKPTPTPNPGSSVVTDSMLTDTIAGNEQEEADEESQNIIESPQPLKQEMMSSVIPNSNNIDTNNVYSNTLNDQIEKPNPSKETKGILQLGYGTWDGGIKDGKPHGSGKITFTTAHTLDRSTLHTANPGDYFIANYDKGSLISGKLYDSEGNLLKTIIP